MSASEVPVLPGTPPPVLQFVYEALGRQEQVVLVNSIRDEQQFTAEHLAFVLTKHGYSISASTIRTYRRALRQEASVKV